jgi:hypothetical protein
MFVSLALLCACSKGTSPAPSAAFLRCWRFQPTSGAVGTIDFEAVIYPREGVLAYNAACPALTLQMIFNDTAMPSGFDAFERANGAHPRLVGIRGTALVMPGRVDHPGLMVVTVRRLIRGEVLSDADTARLLAEMQR